MPIDHSLDHAVMLPGATIGILGGGQLGRMTAMAARSMGYDVQVLDPDPNCASRAVASRTITAPFSDAEAAAELARGCDVVTLEIEGGTLTLIEKTDGFVDLLSPVGLDATLTASLRPEEASRWRRALSQFATNAFGRSMWVSAPREDPRALATR